jgi:hypothetical protein
MPLAAGLAIAAAFIALNYRAYDGFFQDDELANLNWAPLLPLPYYLAALVKPFFAVDNFRPPGHLYFALMGRAFGLDFPPWITPLFAIHLMNAVLLFGLLRKLAIERWCALAGVAFFTLSATAMDAYWKPMYCFDLLCTTFSLASILLWAYRRCVLSFIAFWLAYKSKELAVMLPAVLVAYEYWLGERRFVPLIPFLIASLSFGLQGILLNPNKNNDYTFRLTMHALEKTIPFYARRFLLIPFSGLALFALALVRDRRVWFGLTATLCFVFVLLFLPGRVFEAYAYLPLTGAVIAVTAAASRRVNPAWLWLALALWMPLNIRQLHREQTAKLANDDDAYAFVDSLQSWAEQNPRIVTLVYNGLPNGFHNWGVTGAWDLAHHTLGLRTYSRSAPEPARVREAARVMEIETVALATWDGKSKVLSIQIHNPTRINSPGK